MAESDKKIWKPKGYKKSPTKEERKAAKKKARKDKFRADYKKDREGTMKKLRIKRAKLNGLKPSQIGIKE